MLSILVLIAAFFVGPGALTWWFLTIPLDLLFTFFG